MNYLAIFSRSWCDPYQFSISLLPHYLDRKLHTSSSYHQLGILDVSVWVLSHKVEVCCKKFDSEQRFLPPTVINGPTLKGHPTDRQDHDRA